MTRLVNCTGRDVFVLVGSQLVLLEDAPYPALYGYESEGSATFDSGAGSFELLMEGSAPSAALYLPEQEEGVTYLVDAETLLQLPYRSDLVTPSSYADCNGQSYLYSVHRRLEPASPSISNLTRASVKATIEKALGKI